MEDERYLSRDGIAAYGTADAGTTDAGTADAGTDLVIPMVFPDDGAWQREYARCKGNATGALRHVRYRSWGTEELMVRCCLKFMPWVRRIHILLAGEGQVRPWMTDLAEKREARGTEVRVVMHREFMPAEWLPCFTSPTIEMFLHRIPGLSERFIYANDDMFPLSPLAEDDFFRDGIPCQCLTEKPFPTNPNVFQRKCLYQLNMVARPFGQHFGKTWLKTGHSFAPILKSSCEEVWRRHGEEIRRQLSPLKRTDRSHNHYVYVLYQHFTGRTCEHAPRRQYVGKGTATAELAGIIRDPQAGVVCLNDNEQMDDWERRAAIVRREIWGRVRIDELGVRSDE